MNSREIKSLTRYMQRIRFTHSLLCSFRQIKLVWKMIIINRKIWMFWSCVNCCKCVSGSIFMTHTWIFRTKWKDHSEAYFIGFGSYFFIWFSVGLNGLYCVIYKCNWFWKKSLLCVVCSVNLWTVYETSLIRLSSGIVISVYSVLCNPF